MFWIRPGSELELPENKRQSIVGLSGHDLYLELELQMGFQRFRGSHDR